MAEMYIGSVPEPYTSLHAVTHSPRARLLHLHHSTHCLINASSTLIVARCLLLQALHISMSSDDDPNPSALIRVQKACSGAVRGFDFWSRTTTIYTAYKVCQLRAAAAARFGGQDAESIKEQYWVPQHEWAGEQMYDMCVSLRGFYLKAGQFIGSRGDFVPEQICRKLALLCDQVRTRPPCSPLSDTSLHALHSGTCTWCYIADHTLVHPHL